MNGVKEDNNIQYTMTSKGVWYCLKLSVYNDDLKKAIKESDELMTEIEKTLAKHNGEDNGTES